MLVFAVSISLRVGRDKSVSEADSQNAAVFVADNGGGNDLIPFPVKVQEPRTAAPERAGFPPEQASPLAAEAIVFSPLRFSAHARRKSRAARMNRAPGRDDSLPGRILISPHHSRFSSVSFRMPSIEDEKSK